MSHRSLGLRLEKEDAPVSTPVQVPSQQPAKKRMKTSTKWIIGIVGFALVAALAAALGVISLLFPVQRVVDGSPEPVVEAQIADGDWFAFVTVGEDETGAITLGVDLADMLTGQEAHDAAVEAGVISPDEDLPNDFFIKNDVVASESMHLSDNAVIEVIPADDVSTHIAVTPEQLAALFDGTYVGGEVYGVAVGEPIPMYVTIEDGLVTSAVAVYLP
jgi:hypothetical protein